MPEADQTQINEILGRVTWGNVLRLNLCDEGVEYAQGVLGLERNTRLTYEHLDRTREFSPPWADWVLYEIGSRFSELSGDERFLLFDDIKEDYRRYAAARHSPDLTRDQRFDLVNSIGYWYWRNEAARDVPDLTRYQREVLRQGGDNSRRDGNNNPSNQSDADTRIFDLVC